MRASDTRRKTSVWTSTPLLASLNLWTLTWALLSAPARDTTGYIATLLLLQPIWLLRLMKKDPTCRQDLLFTLLVHGVYSFWTTGRLPVLLLSEGWGLVIQTKQSSELSWLWQDESRFYLFSLGLLGGCAVLASTILNCGRLLEPTAPSSSPNAPAAETSKISKPLLPPLLLPSRTTHSRIFPKKHSFSYSYLYAGVPITPNTQTSAKSHNPALSTDDNQGWFQIHGADYLHRGQGSLRQKLHAFLESQGMGTESLDFVYLVTAPRLLGYAFNPVSFWYLYDQKGRLVAMVLEVNNTFGERRMYLLKGRREGKGKGNGKEGEKDGEKVVFTDDWEKDFHVSPFNSRKGSYSLKAVDPVAAFELTGRARVDNTIVLRSSKEHAKIVARVFSDGEARDATTISIWELARFVASWWWVGLVTFPRIVWQARKLFFSRKLYVWYRPEVAETSLGREYSAEELVLEDYFWQLVRNAVSCAKTPVRVVYRAAHSARGEMVLESSHEWSKIGRQESPLGLNITSPAFYSRFVHYVHAKEAFDRECLFTDEKNKTLQISSPALLPILLEGMHAQRKAMAESAIRSGRGPIDVLRWSLLRRLRCPPAMQSYGESYLESKSVGDYHIADIRPRPYSEIDGSSSNSATYRRLVTQLFVAERFGAGFPAVVVLYDRVLRWMLIFLAVWCCGRTKQRCVDLWAIATWTSVPYAWRASLLLLTVNALHFWAFIKGVDDR